VLRSEPFSPSRLRARDPSLQAALELLRPTRAIVDLDALAANFGYLRERAGAAEVLCVVKADAYGHGAVAVARRLEAEGAGWFGVALVEEGVELREAGIHGNILLLGGADATQLPHAMLHRLTPAIVSWESFDAACALARERGERLACHVKVDTGMTRLGIPWSDFLTSAERFGPGAPLRIEGLFTHLACSDDPAVPFTGVQLERFRRCRVALEQAGTPRPLIHVASSAGLLTRAETDVDLARPGLALHGLNPFGNEPAPELSPTLTLVSRVARVASVPAGTSVGYGSTFITLRASRLATIPLGYDDGIPRALSGLWEVGIRGQLAPLVGRVSMDLVVADVTGLSDVAAGDDVLVVGAGFPGSARSDDVESVGRVHSIEEMAHRSRTRSRARSAPGCRGCTWRAGRSSGSPRASRDCPPTRRTAPAGELARSHRARVHGLRLPVPEVDGPLPRVRGLVHHGRGGRARGVR
jgi:alanine racemase